MNADFSLSQEVVGSVRAVAGKEEKDGDDDDDDWRSGGVVSVGDNNRQLAASWRAPQVHSSALASVNQLNSQLYNHDCSVQSTTSQVCNNNNNNNKLVNTVSSSLAIAVSESSRERTSASKECNESNIGNEIKSERKKERAEQWLPLQSSLDNNNQERIHANSIIINNNNNKDQQQQQTLSTTSSIQSAHPQRRTDKSASASNRELIEHQLRLAQFSNISSSSATSPFAPSQVPSPNDCNCEPSKCACCNSTTTTSRAIAVDTIDQASCLNSGGSFLFWKFLSNLPKSITQRSKSSASSTLTPEVVSYLATRGQLQRQNQCSLDKGSGTVLTSEKTFHNHAGMSDPAAGVFGRASNLEDKRDTSRVLFSGGQIVSTKSDEPSSGHQQETKMKKLVPARTMTTRTSQALESEQVTSPSSSPPPPPTIPQASCALKLSSQTTHSNHTPTNRQQPNQTNRALETTETGSGTHKLIKIIEILDPLEAQSGPEMDQQQQQSYQMKASSVVANTSKHTHQIKLSIATTTTTTSGRSSAASSLSSCILSADSSVSGARLKWGKKMDFLLSIIGFAVDLANIWRFPYLVYKNGGGVFLIPYLTMLIFGGIPLFFLELCLGQFVKKGPITVWNKICPSMKGVGYCSILISWYVSFYYNVLIAWSVYFIYRSLSSIGGKMPWEDCDNSWNSKGTCVSISQLKELCSTHNETLEACRKEMFSNVNVTSPASEFFVKELSQIDQSTGLNDMGYLRPELVLCTMIVYLLHYFSLFRGLETSGKVVWVTATAPYMILSILLVRGLFLPGAAMGIEYYLSPKLEKLAEPQVWIDAAGQVFYSIGVGFGVHLTYASFNTHNNNCYRDCLMTSAVNAATSVYSGLVVFVYLGYMAKNLGIEIDKVASEGYSLVFEVYPEALTTLPFARFWSILFFIMLLTLGIDSAMGGLEAVITGLEDEFKFAKRLSRGQLTGLVIVSSFIPALISCTQGGAYTLFWFDIYSAGVSLLFSALFETIGVVYCYGLKKFIPNIESMLGRKPHIFYIMCWKYISPIFLGVVIFMSIYTATVPTYRYYTFPLWSVYLGWCLAFSSVSAIPIVAALHWYKRWHQPDKSPMRKRSSRGSSSVTSSRHGSKTGKSPNHV